MKRMTTAALAVFAVVLTGLCANAQDDVCFSFCAPRYQFWFWKDQDVVSWHGGCLRFVTTVVPRVAMATGSPSL